MVALLCSAAALALCAFQFGDRYNLNSMPFAQVRHFVSALPKARALGNEAHDKAEQKKLQARTSGDGYRGRELEDVDYLRRRVRE